MIWGLTAMLLLRIFFTLLPFIRKQSNTFMSDGATRYSTTRKNKGLYYVLIVVVFLLSGIIFYGYREYERLSGQNKQFMAELSTYKTAMSVYPNMTDMLGQNRLLLEQNKLLGDEVLDLRRENARLHGELLKADMDSKALIMKK